LLKNQSSFSEDCLFIGEDSVVEKLLSKKQINDFITIFTAGDNLHLNIIPANINLITTSIDLYNNINSIVRKYQYWSSLFMKAICDKKDIQDLLNLASSIFEAPVYLLNPEYEVLLSSNLQQYSINETNDEFENSLKRNEISKNIQIDVKQRKFYELLEFYDAYAGVSNGTRDYTKIRTMYLLAKSSVHLGRILRKDKNERIFAYEEVSMYCIIHLCVENFIKIYNHDDIIYLTHPAVVALTRHDVAYNDCLRDVLFYYLLNGRSIQKTANAMYMHRNTIQKKINKIEQIICKDLEDGHLQLRLLFSCLVMTYYEKYLQKELRL